MNFINLENKDSVAKFCNDWCKTQVLDYNIKSFFIPAGSSPIALYQLWEETKPSYLEDCDFFQIDEVITGDKNGLFKKFFKQYLPSYEEKISWITDGQNHRAEAAILGLGLNGHIAFHEPTLSPLFEFGEVDLDAQTKITLGLEDNAKGLTYGLGSFLKCKSILMIVTGSNKSDILKALLEESLDIPAKQLLSHKNFTIVCDKAAFNLAD